MKRFLEKSLLEWKKSPHRKPLLLRGARQTGKTYLVREFGKNFDEVVEINFELKPELKSLFIKPDAREIIKLLRITLAAKINAGSTLLFLDEIQECPSAITALRYFYEFFPDLHVIGAGSLLEFTLKADDFRMPVGRVEYRYLKPLCFYEFLESLGETALVSYLKNLTFKKEIPEILHQKAIELFRSYLLVGGMPEAVKKFCEDKYSAHFQDAQLEILQTYRDDFGKYATHAEQHFLQKVFQTAPGLVGKIYKYTKVDILAQSRDIKKAVNLLVSAGVLVKILATSGHGLPFLRDADEKCFKILFTDTGLMQRALGLDAILASSPDFIHSQAGSVTEQYVGQELLSLISSRETPELFFWARTAKNSTAEVDYLVLSGSKIIPVEVKSGTTGRLKSLQIFLEEHKAPFGIRISEHPLSFHEKILSIPLYAVGSLKEILQKL